MIQQRNLKYICWSSENNRILYFFTDKSNNIAVSRHIIADNMVRKQCFLVKAKFRLVLSLIRKVDGLVYEIDEFEESISLGIGSYKNSNIEKKTIMAILDQMVNNGYVTEGD